MRMNAHVLQRCVPLVAIAATALLVAGCGGSSGSPKSASVTLKPVEAMSSMPGMKEGESMAGMKTEKGPTGMLMAPSSAHGKASLRQEGDRLTGTVNVSGLEPNSRHAEHLHGPDGSCEPKKMVTNMAVVLPDLVADSKGEATAKFDFTVHQQVVGPGFFIMVHQRPTPAAERGQIGTAPASPAFMQALSTDPGILCGDVEVSK
jgi:hypothetical protein